MMSKHRPRAVREFTFSAYKQFEMRVVILTAFPDGEGDSSMTLYIYSPIHTCFSQPQITLISITKTAGNLSRTVIATEASTEWCRISENGALSPLMRVYSASRKMR